MKETFRQFFENRYGPYPGVRGERLEVVTERIANALAYWADEVARRTEERQSHD